MTHPRLTVHGRVCPRDTPIEDDLAALAAGGAPRIGLSHAKLAGHVDAVRSSGLPVSHISTGTMRNSDKLRASIDLALEVGASIAYGPAGGDPALEWDDNAARFVSMMGPAAEYAARAGVRILVEPTITLLADISMLHTLEDTVDLAQLSGVGVCIDLQHCWTDRRLRASIERAPELTGLVQLSDWVPGNRHHYRAVPGDGAIPLERIVGWILETGYDGLFDLELEGEPGVPESETVKRALERATALLDKLGA